MLPLLVLPVQTLILRIMLVLLHLEKLRLLLMFSTDLIQFTVFSFANIVSSKLQYELIFRNENKKQAIKLGLSLVKFIFNEQVLPLPPPLVPQPLLP